jgi:NADPH2 dehydrogenase
VANLFSSLIVKNIAIPNRVVFPPMANGMSDDDGAVNDAHIHHYARRARGGVGAIVVEHAYIRPDGCYSPRQLGIHHDGLVPGLQRLADAVKCYDTVVGIQITHAGAKASQSVTGAQPLGPVDGALPAEVFRGKKRGEKARALTQAELAALVQDYVAAAQRALAAGFDFVEVHGAHGFLLSEFLSPLANQRHDEYGGDLAGRLRFPLEVVRAVRRVVDDAHLLFYRLGGSDFIEGGLSLAEGQEAARVLAAAGVDVLDISGGLCGDQTPDWDGSSQGYFVPMAAAIRAGVNVPVIVAGGITEPAYANQIVREGKVDLAAVGRAMLKDADWTEGARAALT